MRFPPFIDPAFANGTAPLAVTPNGLTLPRWQNWSVMYQRQISGNTMLGLSHIGNHGTRLPHNAQRWADANMNDPSVLALGATVLQSNINSAAAQAAGIRPPIPVSQECGAGAAKIPAIPEHLVARRAGGRERCHAPETVLERRFSRGLQARVAYTFSKLNNGSENAQGSDGANATVQNPANRAEWGLSADDTPHVFLVGFTWEVPGSESWSSGVAKALLAGWNLSGVLRYETGRPLNIVMANDLGGFLFNGQKRPNRGPATR